MIEKSRWSRASLFPKLTDPTLSDGSSNMKASVNLYQIIRANWKVRRKTTILIIETIEIATEVKLKWR